MPSNKDRLYITLYARGGAPTMPNKEDTYHWALLMGPKEEVEDGVGVRFHAKERTTGPNTSTWVFEEKESLLTPTSMLLVRVMIAKVERKDRFMSVVRNTPIREGVTGWNCVGWVQEALQHLEADGKALGTGVTEWTKVRNAAMEYCQRKKDEHRFDGLGNYDMRKAPTYDLIERKETIP
ncbi:hypothetical protein P153DRAFT_361116 [Dothidotthia symphoricarpi CBS 119687]|uniref:Uncharacterized protein n=1 Tax=Dothidotthia symphoricarpi CBS 119687 TaxID=1392245 RepID=A0A6A5ZXY5_9PLEO|nr:uncharacterized protein P153DRAFT_361116 [Dothidotthia symphoricarpi CBS 119687]KAF2124399.1 hypothetical protein P153DRAFT_361116 [Dothidotthia symphoricarpi CBS 119687]